MSRGILPSIVLLVALIGALPAAAQEEDEPETVRAAVVEVTPTEDDAAIVVGGRRYGGTVRVAGHGGGLAVVETVDLDRYLVGIQEVPLSWERAALQAQAIAARTYLAWTLARGRTDSGRRHDYDICATDACQVYAGLEPSYTAEGDRWVEAVQSTGADILVFDGEPAQTYYSSTSGGRTRTVSDVWPDVDLPYLRAVESPGEDSPFAEWTWRLPGPQMERLLEEADLLHGPLVDVATTLRADGEGPWTVTVTSREGEETVDTWTLRGILNRAGPAALPQHLPAIRPDGPRYPQTILSPSYTIESVDVPILKPGAPPGMRIYRVNGQGWGHLVGMSQYGAQAMAEQGASAAQILSHYYGGLVPEEAPDHVPEDIEVALVLGASDLDLEVTGPVAVSIDGEEVAAEELGSWSMAADRGSVEVTTPVGLGLPPTIRPGLVGLDGGRLVVRPELTAAAEVSWQVTVDGEEVAAFGPEPVDAGYFSIPVPVGGSVGLRIEATNAHGSDVLEMGDDRTNDGDD